MALDPDLVAKARKIHSETLVACMHTDLIGDVSERHSIGEHGVLKRRQAELFRAGGISCVSDHVIGDTFETQSFPTRDLLNAFHVGRYNPSLVKHSMKILSYMLDDLEESEPDFTRATSVYEIRKAKEQGKIAVVLCFQGMSPLEDEPALLNIYHRLGLRVINLATNRAVPQYTYVPTAAFRELGLTPLGKEMLDEAMRLRMVIDIAAVSERAFFDIAERYDTPLIASAANANAVHEHDGSLTDEQLKVIAQKGGVVGCIANNRTVTNKREKPTLADYVDHVEHMAEVMGIDHVGIGPDIVEDSWYPLEAYHRMFKDVGYWSCLYPDDLEHNSDLPNVTAELLRRGFSESDVKKVLGENLLRVYAQVWGS
jgi:membrane dipeptidase